MRDKTFITGDFAQDMLILEWLPAKSIGAYCRLNRRCHHLIWANIDRIWTFLAPAARMRLLRHFARNDRIVEMAKIMPGLAPKALARFLADNILHGELSRAVLYRGDIGLMNWFHDNGIFNHALFSQNHILFYIDVTHSGHVHVIEWLDRRGYFHQDIVCRRIAREVGRAGNVNMLPFFAETNDDGIVYEIIHGAVEFDNINVLEIVAKWNLGYVDLRVYIKETSFEFDKLNILQWLDDLYPLHLNELKNLIPAIFIRGRVHMIEWIYNKMPFPLSAIPRRCIKRNKQGIIRKLAELGYDIPNELIAINALEHGDLETLKANLESNQSLNKARIFREACERGHFHIAKWLYYTFPSDIPGTVEINKICTGKKRVNCQTSQIHILQWLYDSCFNLKWQYHQKGKASAINWLISTEQIAVLKWLKEHLPCFKPKIVGSVDASPRMLNWLGVRDMNNSQLKEVVMNAIDYSNVRVLKLVLINILGKKHQFISASDITNRALRHSNMAVFQWFYDHGYELNFKTPAINDGVARLGTVLLQWLADKGYEAVICQRDIYYRMRHVINGPSHFDAVNEYIKNILPWQSTLRNIKDKKDYPY